MRVCGLIGLALSCAACAGTAGYGEPSSGAEPAARPDKGSCDAAGAQQHLGKTASQAVGAAILADSGSRVLRWGPPRSAWTMDYRPDRVGVRYDDDQVITGITCG